MSTPHPRIYGMPDSPAWYLTHYFTLFFFSKEVKTMGTWSQDALMLPGNSSPGFSNLQWWNGLFKALALEQLPTIFGCSFKMQYMCWTTSWHKVLGTQLLKCTMYHVTEYKIWPEEFFTWSPHDSARLDALVIWMGVGRDTYIKRGLKIPSYDFHLLSLGSSFCWNNRQRKEYWQA